LQLLNANLFSLLVLFKKQVNFTYKHLDNPN